MQINLRTDENFEIYQQNKEHHIGRSIFEKANLGMVFPFPNGQFPLDYKHLVCVGVIKKMFHIFMHREIKTIKFSSAVIRKISQTLCNISEWIPKDFVRKTRNLEKLER